MMKKHIKWILVCVFLTGCVDLAGNQHTVLKRMGYYNKVPSSSKKPHYKGEIYTMRGGLGVFSTGMNQLRVASHQRFGVPASSIMWYHAGQVAKDVIAREQTRQKHEPVILIGHSLGANEQIKVARRLERKGVSVDLLVTVDAVSQSVVPANVKHVLNVYKPGYVPMFSGLKVKAVNPASTIVENVNVNDLPGVEVNHFTLDKHQVVQERILAAIEKVLIDAKRKDVRARKIA